MAKNRGRLLNSELQRFTSMLITEAKEVGGFSFEKLDELLDVMPGSTVRWARYNRRGVGRGVNASQIQNLENRVARLLGRAAHVIIIINTAWRTPDNEHNVWKYFFKFPGARLNLRHVERENLKLIYGDGWPTYESLSRDGLAYQWQWRILWERGIFDPKPYIKHMGFCQENPREAIIARLSADHYFVKRHAISLQESIVQSRRAHNHS